VRIARFTTGDDPLYGVVMGDLDEHGEPPEDAMIVTLAGDPMYAGVKPLEEQHRLADVRLLAPVIPRSKVVAIGRNYAAHAAEMGSSTRRSRARSTTRASSPSSSGGSAATCPPSRRPT
jgi:2-keto-4-pentenoate hydratase/2-oxohepta-3-ene-1,7-dioic acid hydratase in catechol pathway